ncbi:capsular biosynthesis protein [Paenibacillus sambharensis]|uniref:Capsular biosynthesis protein n=1 Tax=Paenibacillus sambharensis TaxID=1803190 RepID=A0A2W1L8R2_9BACL|nr:HAD hydrolase family protein [Paenibacillus sambharensis]PZD95303.1 capsular biosynthesis protein [Paenibacillus sambharensis]
MRIVIDLDGTLCGLRQEGQTYADVLPLEGAVEAVKQLKAEGHTIIIHTARNMKTTGGNVGGAIANIGLTTQRWLERFEVPYDELVFGKPYGHLYIDDLAHQFQGWEHALTAVKRKGDER